jgi:hypothetical protein
MCRRRMRQESHIWRTERYTDMADGGRSPDAPHRSYTCDRAARGQTPSQPRAQVISRCAHTGSAGHPPLACVLMSAHRSTDRLQFRLRLRCRADSRRCMHHSRSRRRRHSCSARKHTRQRRMPSTTTRRTQQQERGGSDGNAWSPVKTDRYLIAN